MHYLVTGGCGFIGSHLAESLLAAGHCVTVLDDLSSGHIENLPPGAAFIKGSICDPVAVASAVRGIDGCFHLAAIASVERSMQDWLGTHQVNQSGTVVLLEALKRACKVPFVYASSAAVYGGCEALPIVEASPVLPLSAYGADKLGCELQARVATLAHGIPTTGLRFFNVYGPRQDPRSPYSGVISIFCERLARGDGVTIFGDGAQSRDFVYVGDVVRALMAAMAAPAEAPRVLNVCTGRAVSVRELAGLVARLSGTALVLNQRPARAGEVRHSLGSPAALEQVLGVVAGTTLAEGLPRVLAWLRGVSPAMPTGPMPRAATPIPRAAE